ncbi:PIR protein [Plasmodium vivax]|uniref:VIR protein n=1 Tax=Plasmodium vivax TaxID=5855 RepID=A0A564ZVQ7_PLAVI|nr:PIR protein [Plasmodium vivax]
MSIDIKDIAYWKEKYPFLNNMVTAYDEFNSAVTDDDSSTIESLVSVLKSWGGYEEKHKDIYKKLTRNLLLLLNREYKKMSNTDFCRFLYQWVYHNKKKYNINEFYISLFYMTIHDSIVQLGAIKKCPYSTYDNDYEISKNIIKLQNFYSDIDTIEKTLMNESLPQKKDSHYCYAQRYANECVKIYRNMHNTFCSGDKSLIPTNEKICSVLSTFNRIYTDFLFNKGDIKNKIPDLSSNESEKHFLCPLDEPSSGLDLTQRLGRAQGLGQAQEMMSESGQGHRSVSVGIEQPANPAPLNSTAVVGTMIGIPPFLGLIYRFTPIGTMFRSKSKKSINVFNNLNEEIENELFYSRLEKENLNYRPERYNVAYGPV